MQRFRKDGMTLREDGRELYILVYARPSMVKQMHTSRSIEINLAWIIKLVSR